MDTVVVKLVNVSKNYKDKTIIKDFNLEVYEKEFLTILGPSGCGKTTILRMISGLEHVSGGNILLDGVDVTNVIASKREVNTIFQNFALFSHMNVEDNIAFGLKMKKVDKEKIKVEVEKMLDLVKLKGYNKKYPNQLSGGEQQRVVIARAIVNKPKLLICDEPTGNLDPDTSMEIMQVLEQINNMGTTIIMATHDRDIVNRMKKRVIVINEGKLVKDYEKGQYVNERY